MLREHYGGMDAAQATSDCLKGVRIRACVCGCAEWFCGIVVAVHACKYVCVSVSACGVGAIKTAVVVCRFAFAPAPVVGPVGAVPAAYTSSITSFVNDDVRSL